MLLILPNVLKLLHEVKFQFYFLFLQYIYYFKCVLLFLIIPVLTESQSLIVLISLILCVLCWDAQTTNKHGSMFSFNWFSAFACNIYLAVRY